ncbi:MAG: glycosyltransferase family 2 protein [Gammaproteobacteria bacterium]|nr:glycosyltransferase family 2 protein [Gammaproteobacteria bacterium]
MRLSIVSTMYASAPYLEEFHRRATAAARDLTDGYEVVYVNDGSPDDSLEIALGLMAEDPKVRIVDLSRNFGHHKAIMTGCAHARGDLVFLIDCDLEEPPEDLLTLHQVMERERADMVYGVQESRKGGPVERFTGGIFYRVYNRLAAVQVPPNVLTMRLMSRRYVRSLIRHRDHEIYLLGLMCITGYKQVAVPVSKSSRHATSYSLTRRIAMATTAVTTFSTKPLTWMFQIGAVISVLSVLAATCISVRRILYGTTEIGWASLIVSIWLVGGMLMLGIGILGLYLGRVMSEVKDRPYTIVRQVYSHEPHERHGEDGEQGGPK